MWAYVDESGNTGNRIFDPQQPLYMSAALMTRTNFDLSQEAALAAVAHKVGRRALHANELGVARIEEIAPDLLRIVKRADARFFFSRVEKRYLAASKVFDTFFDAGENAAVPWHIYWIRPLRLMMMFKLAHFVLTEDIAQLVWNCVTASSEQASKAYFREAAEAMLPNVPNLPDARSRHIVSDALTWALGNPESFTTFLKDKVDRYSHAPNFVAFTNLLDGLEDASKKWDRPIREIVHDEQSQFGRTLARWHSAVSSPSLRDEEPFRWPGEDKPLRFGRALGSTFRMATEDVSPGLQVIDVVLWLFKRVLDDKEIGQHGARLLNYAFRRGYQNDMSFTGVGESMESALQRIMSEVPSEEQALAGANLLEHFEANRMAGMAAAAARKGAGELAEPSET